MATIYEVSKLAGVSLATVSRVINNSASVRQNTRDRVHNAMEALNYTPNSVAKSLASSRSDCIGVMVSELYGHFFTNLLAAVEKECRKFNKHIVVAASHNQKKREKEDIEFLISRNCDALILHVEALSDEYIINLSNGPIPIVVINRFIPEIADMCIALDNEHGGYIATRYVLERGHRNHVYVSGPSHKSDAQARLEGHKRALAEFGLPYDERRVYEGNYLQTSGTAAFEHVMHEEIDVTAIICGNDEMATGVMSAARERGFNLPQDLSVFGFDNVLFSRYTYPTLSTINYPIKEMATMAAKQVLNRVYKKPMENLKNQFSPEVVSRNSVITARKPHL